MQEFVLDIGQNDIGPCVVRPLVEFLLESPNLRRVCLDFSDTRIGWMGIFCFLPLQNLRPGVHLTLVLRGVLPCTPMAVARSVLQQHLAIHQDLIFLS